MKRFFNPVLLSCVVSMFVFGDLAVGARPAFDSVGREMPLSTGREMRTPSTGREMRTQPQVQPRQTTTPTTRGVKLEPITPTPIPAQTQSPVLSQSLPPASTQVQSQPYRPIPQVQPLTVHQYQYQIHRGIGQRLRLGVGAGEYSGEGILVTHVLENSPGYFAGLVAGDVILEINRMPINDLTDYSYAVDRSPETMNVKVSNDGRESLITVELRY